jgi:hypothetical protein
MTGGAPIQTSRLAALHHGNVRNDLATAQMSHEIFAVVALVSAQRAGRPGFLPAC